METKEKCFGSAKIYFHATASAAFLVIAISAAWYAGAYSRSVLPQRTFAVSGDGRVIAVPDVAKLSFGVLTEGGKDLSDIQVENTEKINKVIAFIKSNGVDEEDIKTEYYNISPRYQYFSCPGNVAPFGVSEFEAVPCPPAEIVGYTINQSVSVKVRDLSDIGIIIAGVVDAGANNVFGPNFTIDDPDELQNQARAEAIAEAREKAKEIAKAGKFRLGKLVSIQEGGYYPQPLRAYDTFAVAESKGAAAPSIEPGSEEVNITVSLVYEIK